MTETFAGLTEQQVAAEITTWAGRVAAGEARLLALLVEFDRREAWAAQGCVSLAQWLSLHLGLAPRAAQEKARVARALIVLPLIAEAMGRGELSYSQVRALTRVASAEDEGNWIDIARVSTGSQLERIVRGLRRARKPAEDETDPERARWRMRSSVRYDGDGMMLITVNGPRRAGRGRPGRAGRGAGGDRPGAGRRGGTGRLGCAFRGTQLSTGIPAAG